jgi:phospholipase A1
MYGLSFTAFVWMLVVCCVLPAHAEEPRTLEECSCISDDGERLRCYDRFVGVKMTMNATVRDVAPSSEPGASILAVPEEKQSYLSRRWELDESKPRGRFAFMPHRENYILPVAYNKSPNKEPGHMGDNVDVKETEVKFQLSFKVKLWQDVLDQNMDLWFGYTQKSFWQLYDVEDSAPFRETNYEPEMLLNYRTDIPVLGLRLRTLTLGFNHQSNGRSEPLSRSWNRVVANVGLEKDDFVLQLKSWYRIPESEDEDDNPDLDKCMGPGELWAWYLWGPQRFGVMWRNNFRFDDNRGALQLEWAFPLGRKVSGYIQYFTGYGESLLDYDHPVDRIGIGFILDDWN